MMGGNQSHLEQVARLQRLIEGLCKDRDALVKALNDIQRVAAWMTKRGVGRGQDEILDIIATVMDGLAIPTCFQPKQESTEDGAA